jgi:ABC-2 type transport system ATP-binding protein
MSALVSLDHLSRRFGSIVAVDDLSLSVGVGEVLGFLGPNGAGKTTTMRLIAGFLEPSGGRATVGGLDVVRSPIEVKRRLGYLPEGAPIYGDMSARGFLNFVAAARGLRGDARRRAIDDVVDKVSLAPVFDQRIDTLSKGFKRRIGLAQAIVHDPDVLILDEPTDGLDPNQKYDVRRLIRAMAPGKAIIISTHILEEVEAVCSRAAIIADGRLVADGTAETLLSRLPRHRSVWVRVPASEAETARTVLGQLSDASSLEKERTVDGAVQFWVGGAGGETSVVEVSRRLTAAQVTIEALSVEHGRLDDVFRLLTTGQATADAGADVGENPAHG